MPITVIDILRQKNDAIFPLLEDRDLLGGFRSVPITSGGSYPLTPDRDNIPASYRKEGMFVWTCDTGKLWRLAADLVTWIEFTGGGGSGTENIDTLPCAVVTTAGIPLALDGTGTLQLADADPVGMQEVYGLAQSGGPAGIITVVTAGLCSWAGAPFASVGQPVYLAVGTGITQTPPPGSSPAGTMILRIGIARSPTTIMVRIQPVART